MSKLHELNTNAIEATHARGAIYPITSTVATNAVEDDDFYIVDGTDNTKRLAFQLSGLTTATDRTITVPDYSFTLGSGVGGLRSIVDTGGAFATPIVLTAADSGKIYLLDDAAGLDFTLPAITAANVGMQFEFLLKVEATTNSYRWTAQTGDAMTGLVIVYDKDLAEGSTEALQQIFRPTTELICTIGSSDDTQGVLVGGRMRFTAWSATGWDVRGELVGDGALATLFS